MVASRQDWRQSDPGGLPFDQSAIVILKISKQMFVASYAAILPKRRIRP
jgi:hypothetical protein